MTTLNIFLLGMAGAMAPEITRLYSIRNTPDKFKWSWFYLVVSLLFSALGGLLAVILPATTLWAALYIGIATPIVVNTVLKKGVDFQKQEFKGSSPERQQKSFSESYLSAL